MANAKEATQNFSKDKQSPLAANSNSTSKPGITFAAQDKLPKLPIPDLDATCKRYLASLEPLQSAREHAESKRAVDSFLHNEGPDLQEKLKAYSAGKSSYIEQFCKSKALNPFSSCSHPRC
jgi:carnitine O-acetyltransferase